MPVWIFIPNIYFLRSELHILAVDNTNLTLLHNICAEPCTWPSFHTEINRQAWKAQTLYSNIVLDSNPIS